MSNFHLLKNMGFVLGPVVAVQAYSEVYMTEEKAVQALFPHHETHGSHNVQDSKFAKVTLELTENDIKYIEQTCGETIRSKKINFWRDTKKNVMYVDQVLGKHEFITYAVGINSDHKTVGIEILEYRESYGHQIKGREWRQQFVGKDEKSPLKLDQDIRNISGATLSSAHVTAGVRRILKTHERLRSRL